MRVTYVLIPRKGLGSAIQTLAHQPLELAVASAKMARAVLEGSELEEGPVLTAHGLITKREVKTGEEAWEEAREGGAPRVLEGLDVSTTMPVQETTILLRVSGPPTPTMRSLPSAIGALKRLPEL